MFAANATITTKLIFALLCCAVIPQTTAGQQPDSDSFHPPPSGKFAQPLEETDQSPTQEGFADANDPSQVRQGSSSVGTKSLIELQARTQSIIAKSAAAVVAIGETGSGVIVSSQGLILTASHVTRFANRKVSVVLSDGRVIEGITLGSNSASDTGAIQLLSPGPFPFVPVENSDNAAPGAWCIAMGYPLSFPRGRPAAGRLGRILHRDKNGKLVSDCTIMGGDSGGPLLDLAGNVIAISSSVKLGSDQNLYIPSQQFIRDWKNIALSIDKTSIGARTEPSSSSSGGARVRHRPAGKAYLGINAETDQNIVRIRAVHRASPAEFAGIKPQDVIVQMDSKPINSFAAIVAHLKTRKPGGTLLVLLNRYGSLIRTEVTLGGTSAQK